MNIGADFFERATEKYRQQLKSYGNGKRKTKEQCSADIWAWRRAEEARILKPYEERMMKWRQNPFKGGWHKGPITKKSYRSRPRASKRMREELDDVFRAFVRKLRRLERRTQPI